MTEDQTPRHLEAAIERAKSVKREHEAELLSKANVVGVGVGLRLQNGEPTGQVGLVVFVSRKVPASQLETDDIIPGEIDDILVDVQEIGQIRPLGSTY